MAEKVAVRDDAGVGIDDALSVLDEGAIVAGEAVSGELVPAGAEVADGNTDVLRVEVPSLGAGLADSADPGGTSDVALGGGVDFAAFSIDDRVSFIADLTDSLL